MSDDKMEMMNWLACGERGTSSNTMVEFITGVKACRCGTSHPYDPDDFRRCRLLCEQVSVIRDNIAKMKQCSPEWSILVDHWKELCDVMDKEAATPRLERVGHPTYEMMQRLFRQCKKEVKE